MDIQNRKAYSELGVSKPMAHSEPETYLESWAIQNPGIFRIKGKYEKIVYLKSIFIFGNAFRV